MGGGRHEPLPGMSHRVVATSGVEDLVTLRPYVVGDDLRRVHWPSTAHADELQVRRDEERWQGHLTVLLDAQRRCARAPRRFERAVSAAAGIIHAVAESRRPGPPGDHRRHRLGHGRRPARLATPCSRTWP